MKELDVMAEKMVKYVAFLRGINVGGKNVIKMEALGKAFEQMGFQSVKTYIQSGNVLFQSDIADKRELEKIIEKSLSERFKFEAKVLVRSKKDMENTIKRFPSIFENPDWKHNVLFLSSAIDSKNILNQFDIKKDIEVISYYKGVLFWSAKLDTITRSKMLKLSTRKEYQEMTVRNINTTKKILELMNGME
jgi:uncharacterized protein (DUF1697 family)